MAAARRAQVEAGIFGRRLQVKPVTRRIQVQSRVEDCCWLPVRLRRQAEYGAKLFSGVCAPEMHLFLLASWKLLQIPNSPTDSLHILVEPLHKLETGKLCSTEPIPSCCAGKQTGSANSFLYTVPMIGKRSHTTYHKGSILIDWHILYV